MEVSVLRGMGMKVTQLVIMTGMEAANEAQLPNAPPVPPLLLQGPAASTRSILQYHHYT